MKRFWALAAGILTAILTTIIVVTVSFATNIDVQSFSFFFIIPVGSIIAGILGTAGYPVVLRLTNQKARRIDYILGLFLGFLTACTIYFAFYFFTLEYLIYPTNNSIKITPTYLKTDQNFIDYFLDNVIHREMSFSFKSRDLGSIPDNPVLGWIAFIIEFFGYLFGSLVIFGGVLSTKYCDQCSLYYKKKKWLEIDVDSDPMLMDRISDCVKHKGNIFELLKNYSNKIGTINMVFEGESCPKCQDGIFRTKFNVNKYGEKKEMDDLTRELKMKNNMVVEGIFEGKEISQILKANVKKV